MELFHKIWVTPDIMADIPVDILVDILCHNLDIRAMAHAVQIIRECRKEIFRRFRRDELIVQSVWP